MLYLVVSNVIAFLILVFSIIKCLKYRRDQKAFHRLADHVNIGYYRYRCRDGVVLAANKGFAKILELDMSARDVVGRSLSELFIYVEGEGSIRELLKARGKIKDHEYRFKTLAGKDKCILHNSYITRDHYHNEDVVEALIEDITEEKTSHGKMKESQERYEKLFKNAGDMVVICRLDDLAIEEVNPITEVVTGFLEEELIGTSFENLLHPLRRRALKNVREDLLFKGTGGMETVVVCKNGAYKEVILTLSVFEIKENRMIMAIIKDVSALVKEREEQERRREEMESFWKASVEREERIKGLRLELERAKQQLKLLKEKK